MTERVKLIVSSLMAMLTISGGLIILNIDFLITHRILVEVIALLAAFVSVHIAAVYGHYAYKWGFFNYTHSKRSEDFRINDEIVSLKRLLHTASTICTYVTNQSSMATNDNLPISKHDILMLTSHMYCVRDSLVHIRATSIRSLRPLTLADDIINEMQTTTPNATTMLSIKNRISLIQALVKEFQHTLR